MDRVCICPICSSSTRAIGKRPGILDSREFIIRQCGECYFSFIENYRDDFNEIYNKDYYLGKGADPSVNYLYELNNSEKTIRNYEWNGILKIASRLIPAGSHWLDFGCGSGGLVKVARNIGMNIIGYDEGWAASISQEQGVPIINKMDFENYHGFFDLVTAIEVFEHIPNPVDEFKKIRLLLKPGGKLFFTTGNSRPWRNKMDKWGYTKCADVHISFFEPSTLERVMSLSGFSPFYHNITEDFDEIIKFKVLKSFGLVNRNKYIDCLPWSLISKIVDAKYQVTKIPYGIAI